MKLIQTLLNFFFTLKRKHVRKNSRLDNMYKAIQVMGKVKCYMVSQVLDVARNVLHISVK
jgi:hypothetical protein